MPKTSWGLGYQFLRATSQPGLLVQPEWLPAGDRRPLAKLPAGRQSLQKPAEVVNSKLQLLLFFVMWVHGYKKVLPSSYKGVGPAHLSWVYV